MLRRCSPFFAINGFKFLENKIVDNDISGAAELLETISFTLTRQDEAIYTQKAVKSLQISTTSGSLGVNPNHEYKISKLLPGPLKIEFPDGTQQTFFLSGGFANINSAGSVDINAVEAVALQDLDLQAAQKELSAAEADSQTGSESEKAIAQIRVQVAEAVIAALQAQSA